MALTTEIGPALRHLRKRRKMTQRSIGDAAGISKNLISNWETGATAPSLASLESVMEVLGIDLLDIHYAMRGEERPFAPDAPPPSPRPDASDQEVATFVAGRILRILRDSTATVQILRTRWVRQG